MNRRITMATDGFMARYLKHETHRIDNLELKTTGKHLNATPNPTTMEIVLWEGNSCCTIAYWVRSREGFDLRFVGGRPFELDVDHVDFMLLASQGQRRLDEYFDRMEVD